MEQKNKVRMTMNQGIEVVIAAYNEEKNIEPIVNRTLSWLKTQTDDYLVTVVNDGSTDNTAKILDSTTSKNKNLKVIHHGKNLGVGEAWRTGFASATKEIIFSCPADQQFDPFDFSKAIAPLLNGADIISIYRQNREEYNALRWMLSNFHALLSKIFLKLAIKDINWVKGYKRWVLKELDLGKKNGSIELEILAKATKRGAKIIQVGAPHYKRHYGKTKVITLKNVFTVFFELIKTYLAVRKFK